MCESGRSTQLSLGGGQVGNGSVWCPEKTGFSLQILPQVLPMSETYMEKLSMAHLNSFRRSGKGQTQIMVLSALFNQLNTDERFYNLKLSQTLYITSLSASPFVKW